MRRNVYSTSEQLRDLLHTPMYGEKLGTAPSGNHSRLRSSHGRTARQEIPRGASRLSREPLVSTAPAYPITPPDPDAKESRGGPGGEACQAVPHLRHYRRSQIRRTSKRLLLVVSKDRQSRRKKTRPSATSRSRPGRAKTAISKEGDRETQRSIVQANADLVTRHETRATDVLSTNEGGPK